MSESANKTQLIQNLTDLEEEKILKLVRERLQAGDDPLIILDEAKEGMRLVGELYQEQQYYISGLMMAGEIFRQVMELVEPALVANLSGQETGHILLATVEGDIHNIGKNIFNTMLRCYGFTVTDLGEDIPTQQIIEQTLATRPDIIGLSGLLTVSYDAMKATVTQLRALDDSEVAKTPVIIGGGLVNSLVCAYVGAEYWAIDAAVGIDLCREIMANLGKSGRYTVLD